MTSNSELPHEIHNADGASTIVLLHSLALDHTIWAGFLPYLPPAAAVVTCDLPGHGPTPCGDPSSVESMADDVASLIKSLGRDPVTLVGMSLGGSVAQAVTIRHPELIGALGLVDTTAWYGPDAPQAWAGRAAQAREKGLLSLSAFQLQRWFSDDFRAQHPELGEQLLTIFAKNDIDNYAASCTSLGAMDLRDGLPSIAVPTAIAVGELDQATPPAHARVLAETIRGAALTELSGCKHLSALERPADVAEALAPVLQLSPQ